MIVCPLNDYLHLSTDAPLQSVSFLHFMIRTMLNSSSAQPPLSTVPISVGNAAENLTADQSAFSAPSHVPREKAQARHAARKAMSYARRRAVTACLRCRARKTKCDNQRPRCGFCQQVGAECQYDDSSDHSSFDPASLHILSQLDQIIQRQGLVLQCVRTINPSLPQSPGKWSGWTEISAPANRYAVGVAAQWESSADYLKIPSSRTTPDVILSWPVFEDKYEPHCLQAAIFASSPWGVDIESGRTPHPQTARASNSILEETNVLRLVERFLSLVHTKNPILNDDALRKFAKVVDEDGLSWDGPSCLVLLACALGILASPFGDARMQATTDATAYRQLPCLRDTAVLQTAESYYTLARRRIGLLRQSIIASQCFFLSGVYLMYALRPVEAYQEFHQASIIYQMCLKWGQVTANTPQAQRLEQRMYWSCFKSECEIISEIPLPESGIADFEYPHMFPSPPNPASRAASPAHSPEDTASSGRAGAGTSRREKEQSWFYYLSEIALRRIGNRVLNAFYRDEPSVWLNMAVQPMMEVAEQFGHLLNQWHEGLPPLLTYDRGELSAIALEELPFMIRVRELEIRSWIMRPFLFYAIHHPHFDQKIRPIAEQAFNYSVALIESNSLRHRHHGIWYTCRVSASEAFSILATARCGRISLPANWQGVVQLAIETLRYWEDEAPGDLLKARTILEELLLAAT